MEVFPRCFLLSDLSPPHHCRPHSGRENVEGSSCYGDQARERSWAKPHPWDLGRGLGPEAVGRLGGRGRSGITPCALKSLEAGRQQGPLSRPRNGHPPAGPSAAPQLPGAVLSTAPEQALRDPPLRRPPPSARVPHPFPGPCPNPSSAVSPRPCCTEWGPACSRWGQHVLVALTAQLRSLREATCWPPLPRPPERPLDAGRDQTDRARADGDAGPQLDFGLADASTLGSSVPNIDRLVST